MSRKGAFGVVLMVAVLITLLYIMEATNWQSQDMVIFGKPLREIAYPVQQGVAFLSDGLKDFGGYFKDNQSLRAENQRLQTQLEHLTGELLELKDIREENQRLMAFMDYKSLKRSQYDLCLAEVIGRDPNNWYQTIIVNQGSQNGIMVDMAVITPLGLVGRVVAVTPHTAEVLLLVDNESAVGARVFETRVTPGVVVGNGQSDLLEMIHLAHDEAIAVGNTIITSGFSSIFPKGLGIGLVEEVKLEPNGLTQKALIKPFVDFSRLEEVMIIRQVLARDTTESAENPDYAAQGGAAQ